MSEVSLVISLSAQQLELRSNGSARIYPVSTSARGAGERNGSECTPRGRHVIFSKIGGDAPLNAVFAGRRPTGEIWSPALAETHPDRDWILTRILWLEGCEAGVNRGGDVDTRQRYIYIHGTPDPEPMGVPRSHGCVRMRNEDIVELFDAVDIGTTVDIRESR